jgi:hypothetical protein
MLHSKGDGSSYAQFQPNVPSDAIYDVYGWWVASTNRCKDTPFIIHHKHGIDTVYKDQTTNGSSWVSIGTYTFCGDSSEKIIISDKAVNGTYVVADAIRLVTYDTTTTAISSFLNDQLPRMLVLEQNYPNPFNPLTIIKYEIVNTSYVELIVYNTLGQSVATLVSETKAPGKYSVEWDADNFVSGVYYYRLSTQKGQAQTKKLILLK